MDESVIEKFYAKLVKHLPMDDAEFRASLKTAGLLPGNLKHVIASKPTRADKAECFLDDGINNDIESFSKLLTVMGNSEYNQLKVLVSEIWGESIPSCVETGVHSLSSVKHQATLLDEVQNKLKTAYKHICHSDNPHYYIQLALVRDEICDIEDEKLNKITRLTLQGHVDEILRIKEPLKRGLEDIFHYNNLPCPRLIQILGAPGIGKTTLANELCLKWAKDTDCFLSNDFDLVILIRLRAVQERTLQQVMIDAVGSEAAYDELLAKSHGNRCLIILEGLDEISAHWWQKDTMFRQLVQDTVSLSLANILVTSRPHAFVPLYKSTKTYTRTIEIVGFDKPQIKEYAKLHFHNSDTTEKFMEQINNDSHISSLCYVPLCLNMVLECFKKNKETLFYTTLTKIYQSFIISKVDEHVHFKKSVSLGTVLDSDEPSFKNLTTLLSGIPNVLSKEALETMFLLSKLAYKSYFEWSECGCYVICNNERNTERNPKIIFTNADLVHCDITNSGNDACGLLKATNTLFATGNTAVYTFNHLSVQEYFCALYISLLPEDQQLQLLKGHITDHPHMWPFYAGITKLRSPDVLHYLQQYFLQDNQLEKINFIDCATVEKNQNASKYETIVILNSIYEARVQLSLDFNKHELFSLFITLHGLRPYDFMSISYLMSVFPITHLFLRRCSIRDQEAGMLARCKHFLPSLKVLDLSYNDITHKGMKSVVTIIKSSPSLTHFAVFRNPIGDSGIQVFSLLKLKHLIQLDLGFISYFNQEMIKVNSCGLCECFEHNDSLQSLEIGYNKIEDNGIIRVANNLPNTLVRLIITHCYFTYDGAVEIGEMLKINHTLKYIHIAGNSIGDDGISAISDSLHFNATLIQLVARTCKFNVKGVESVAKMLDVNKTLKYLDISNNEIGDDGIAAVTCSIQANTTLLELTAFKCEFHCNGLQSIDKMLKVNKILKKLDIAYNKAEEVAISKVVNTFFKSDCNLMQLNLGHDKFEEYETIEKCFDNAYRQNSNQAGTRAAHCTKHFNRINFGDIVGQFASQLQYHNQQSKDLGSNEGHLEEWLMVDESSPCFD